MAELSTEGREKLSKKQFALPGSRRFPIEDKAHASNAKARATQEYNKGHISESTKNKVHAKANKKLGKKKGED